MYYLEMLRKLHFISSLRSENDPAHCGEEIRRKDTAEIGSKYWGPSKTVRPQLYVSNGDSSCNGTVLQAWPVKVVRNPYYKRQLELVVPDHLPPPIIEKSSLYDRENEIFVQKAEEEDDKLFVSDSHYKLLTAWLTQPLQLLKRKRE